MHRGTEHVSMIPQPVLVLGDDASAQGDDKLI
jgi:hypothetical protein